MELLRWGHITCFARVAIDQVFWVFVAVVMVVVPVFSFRGIFGPDY